MYGQREVAVNVERFDTVTGSLMTDDTHIFLVKNNKLVKIWMWE